MKFIQFNMISGVRKDLCHMSLIFWIILTIGIICTVISVPNSYDKNNSNKKDAIGKTIYTTVLGVVATITLAIAANFVYDFIKGNSTNSNTNESIPVIDVDNGNNMIQQGNGNTIVNNYNTINSGSEENDVEKITMSEINYAEHLKSIVGDNILFFDYNDYDGDGNCEAFALVKEDSYEITDYNDLLRGKIWFVNQNGAIEVESYELLYSASPYFFSAGDKAFIAFNTYYGLNGRKTYIWGVNNQIPYQPNISGKGNGFHINKYNEIELCHSTLDLVWDKASDECTGRTDKDYYFYFDGITFKEYGGIEIEVKDIQRLPNGNDIINWIYEHSLIIDSIYYRENGIININIHEEFYEDSVRRFHIDMRCDEGNIYLLNDEINLGLSELNLGLYLKALRPEIATYPEKFPY